MPIDKTTSKARKQLYRKEWESQTWASGWLGESRRGTDKAHCMVCDKHYSAGKSDLEKHYKSQQHITNMKARRGTTSIAAALFSSDPVIKAELNLVALVARENLSFNLMNSLEKTVKYVADDSKAVKGMSCKRTKCTYLLTECLGPYTHTALVEELKRAGRFTILCDKSTTLGLLLGT